MGGDGAEEFYSEHSAQQTWWEGFPLTLKGIPANFPADTLQFCISSPDLSYKGWLLHFMTNNYVFACYSWLNNQTASYSAFQVIAERTTVYGFFFSRLFWIKVLF